MYLYFYCLCLCICLYHRIFVGQVMSPPHPDKMSHRSQVCRDALWWCSLNVFVSVIVFVFVFVFIFFWLGHVSSPLWSNVSKVTSLWNRSLKVLFKCNCLCHCLCLCLCLCLCICNIYCLFLVRWGLLITLIKCLKGHKSLGLLFEGALLTYLSLLLSLSLYLSL